MPLLACIPLFKIWLLLQQRTRSSCNMMVCALGITEESILALNLWVPLLAKAYKHPRYGTKPGWDWPDDQPYGFIDTPIAKRHAAKTCRYRDYPQPYEIPDHVRNGQQYVRCVPNDFDEHAAVTRLETNQIWRLWRWCLFFLDICSGIDSSILL